MIPLDQQAHTLFGVDRGKIQYEIVQQFPI